jgi:hypothetical protein
MSPLFDDALYMFTLVMHSVLVLAAGYFRKAGKRAGVCQFKQLTQ